MRYIVTEPVPGGYAWWDVRDTQDPHMPNRPVISVAKDLSRAEFLVRNECERLNMQEAN